MVIFSAKSIHALLPLLQRQLPFPNTIIFKSLNNYSLVFLKKESDPVSTSSLLKDLEKGWPQRFIAEDYSINLFESSGQIFGILGLMSLFVVFTSWISDDKFPFYKVLTSVKMYLKWNGLLQQLRTYTLPLIISCLLQINLALFTSHSSLFSLITAVIFLFVTVIFIIKMFVILRNIPYGRSRVALYSFRYGVLWRGLNLKSKLGRYYYFIVLIRSISLAYLCVLFDMYPYVQIIGAIIIQSGIVIFHFEPKSKGKFRKIFQDKLINILSFSIETLLLLLKITLLVFYFIRRNSEDEDLLLFWSFSIIVFGALIQVILICFMVYVQFKNRRQFFILLKNLLRKISGKSAKKRINRITKSGSRLGNLKFQIKEIKSSNKNIQLKVNSGK